jgi:hypothetical protein
VSSQKKNHEAQGTIIFRSQAVTRDGHFPDTITTAAVSTSSDASAAAAKNYVQKAPESTHCPRKCA